MPWQDAGSPWLEHQPERFISILQTPNVTGDQRKTLQSISASVFQTSRAQRANYPANQWERMSVCGRGSVPEAEFCFLTECNFKCEFGNGAKPQSKETREVWRICRTLFKPTSWALREQITKRDWWAKLTAYDAPRCTHHISYFTQHDNIPLRQTWDGQN